MALMLMLVFPVPSIAQGFHPGLSGLMTCTASAVPATSRAEGIAELLGDVIAQCTLSSTVGVPPSVQANIGVTLNVNVTNNRNFGLGGEVTDAVLIVNDTVGTPTASSTPSFVPNTPIPQYGTRVAPNRLEWNGAILPTPSVAANPATLIIRITNLRGNVSQLGIPSGSQVTAYISISTSQTVIPVSNNVLNLNIGIPEPRFVDTGSSNQRPMYSIARCNTTILFPFVTNQAGFDTGLSISNTSRDPFGTGDDSCKNILMDILKADAGTVGTPRLSAEPQVEEQKPSFWESLVPALIPSIGVGIGGDRERRERRYPGNPCSPK